MTAASVRELRGRHVLFALCGFFGAMLAVNAAFVYFAVSTFNGIESGAYETGLRYNTRIAAGDRQAALGWSHKVALGSDGSVRVLVADRQGAPVSELVLAGDIGRPVADRFTRTLAFRETGAGLYLAPAADLPPGSWIVSVEATHGGDAAYQIKERLWLKPRP
jgi:nitrogen fixation protein FixH